MFDNSQSWERERERERKREIARGGVRKRACCVDQIITKRTQQSVQMHEIDLKQSRKKKQKSKSNRENMKEYFL